MGVILDRVCAMDVHKDTIKACVRVPGQDKERAQTITTFGTKTADLLALRDWLERWVVAMESMGEYWKPVYFLLEDRFQVLLANPAHIKNLPGCKTDAKDGSWVFKVHSSGAGQERRYRRSVTVQ
ncbi:MAG: IS110 family transposase [Bryobacteraceae bacterium]